MKESLRSVEGGAEVHQTSQTLENSVEGRITSVFNRVREAMTEFFQDVQNRHGIRQIAREMGRGVAIATGIGGALVPVGGLGTLLTACGEEDHGHGASGGSTDVDDFFNAQMTSGGDIMPTADIPWIDGGKIDTGMRRNFVTSFTENDDSFEIITSSGENAPDQHIYKIIGSIDPDTGDLTATNINPVDISADTTAEYDYLQANGSEYTLAKLPGNGTIYLLENGVKKILYSADGYTGPTEISPTLDKTKIFVTAGSKLYILSLPVSSEETMESVETSYSGEYFERPCMLPNNAQRFVATLDAGTSTGYAPCEFEYQGGMWQKRSCLRDSDVKGAYQSVISTGGNYLAYTWLDDTADLKYAKADTDGDTVPNVIDNCKDVANSSQADSDGDGIGDACDTPPPDPDADGDGYTVGDGDCDDGNSAINPGATEICTDGIDNNCDGKKDTADTVTCANYIDNDGDGYTENQGDCNDGSSAVHPGATEVCTDGLDNDCDTKIDMADTTDCTPGTDADGDGWSIEDGDCDDGNRDVYPGAPKIDGNPIAEACDGDYGPPTESGEDFDIWSEKPVGVNGQVITLEGADVDIVTNAPENTIIDTAAGQFTILVGSPGFSEEGNLFRMTGSEDPISTTFETLNGRIFDVLADIVEREK